MDERPPTPPAPSGTELVPLEACVGRDMGELGRKGSLLAWAAAQGMRTPGGLVLPASRFWAALDACGVRQQAQYLAAAALRLDPRHTLDLAAAIHAALGAPGAEARARDHAEQARALLPAGRMVCRSSSVLEDGRTASYPGVFVSRLRLTSAADLATAILDCWRSAFSQTAIRYLLRVGTEPIDFSLAVLIQPQIEARWYGLYVSVDPVSGAATPIAELTSAGPDALVGGAAAAVRARRADEGWQLEPSAPSLLAPLAKVSAMAGRLAAYMPGALDIEFALPSVEAEPVLLQCRPMSATRPARGAGPKWGSGKRITGRPCAGGVATGIVVPRGENVPADESAIALVDTLSTHDYDLIFRHEGVIATEDISPLSHPAILCRELGVPLICATGARAARLAGRRVMLDGGSGIAEVLPAGRPVPAESLPPERALYLTDVERALMIHVDAAAGGDPAGAPPEAVLARSLGAREVRVLRVPLAESETQELASLPEQGRREPISAQ